MRVVADTSVCQGHQLCQLEAPDVFGFDAGEDVVEVLVERPDESRRKDVAAAVKYCPAFALSLEED
ncbi:ferredoxin [Actinomadura sp. WMMA1423]|uniref:ferredoxin n=1 Tax=Actinomadura sp. WMMA1423 TaxID=2591108 RepID=UPI0011475EE8|nr:ferredoxin [Actinomadura sp. WMMA1423]